MHAVPVALQSHVMLPAKEVPACAQACRGLFKGMHAGEYEKGLPNGRVQPEVEDGCSIVPGHPLLGAPVRRQVVRQREAEPDAVRVCCCHHLIEPLGMHVWFVMVLVM